MFRATKSSFETIVVSALVLIYLSVISSFAMLGYGFFEKGTQDFARFIELAKALHIKTEIYEEALKENQEEIQKGQAAFWIAAVFRLVFALIAGIALIYAL
jgi:23S rRNA G2069 N7-methylase RlmK/C1962 C5-methylase RlmI